MILELKVSGLVEEWMAFSNSTLQDSLHKVYNSEVYAVLNREETKLWHHSPQLLLDCLIQEVTKGSPEFPDE
jgi:hypothetical protein